MLKTKIIIILLLFCQFACGQSINRIINISDTLTFTKEIRIYKFFSTSNYAEVIRVYQATNKSWKAELFKCFKATNVNDESTFEKISIKNKTDFDVLWLKILSTDIENLAEWDKINYKFRKNVGITTDQGKQELKWEEVHIFDGYFYEVIIRNGDKTNFVKYFNPEEYIKHFSEVDELNSFVELLNLMKTEFE